MSSHLGDPGEAQLGVARTEEEPATPGAMHVDRTRSLFRFVIAVALAGGVTYFLWHQVPNTLSIKTAIVGYPIFYAFDYQRYTYAYYAFAFAFPLLAIAAYYLLARVGPLAKSQNTPSMFPLVTAGTPGGPEDTEDGGPAAEPNATPDRPLPVAIAWAVCRVGLPAFTVAVEMSAARSAHLKVLSRSGVAAGLLYVAVVAGLALLAWYRTRHPRDALGAPTVEVPWEYLLGRANSLAAIAVVPLLYLVSRSTNVSISSTHKVAGYPWLPLWVVLVLTALCLGLWVRAGRRSSGRADGREAAVLTWVVGPVLLFLALASLPSALGPFSGFDDAQFLASPQLIFGHGLFPWGGVYLIHGILGDLLDGGVGMALFGNTRWGSSAGYGIIVDPATWLVFYAFVAYFFKRNRVVLVGFGIAVATGFLAGDVGKFVLLPVVIILFDRVLKRPSWRWCGLLALVMFAFAVVTPEAVAFVVCLVVLIPVFELASRQPGTRLVAAFPRTVRVGAICAGLVLGWVVYLSLVGSLSAFIDYYTVITPGHTLWGAYPTAWPLATKLATTVEFFLPPILWLLTVWKVVALLRRRSQWRTFDWCMVAAAAIAAAYYPEALGRADPGHVNDAFAATVPLLILWVAEVLREGDRWVAAAASRLRQTRRTAGRLAAGARSQVSGSWIRAGASVGAVALVVAVTAAGVDVPSGSPADLADGIPGRLHATSPVPAPSNVPRLGYVIPGTVDTAEVARLGVLLDRYAGKDGPVFDFANELGVTYYLLNRVPGSRIFHIEMAQSAGEQDQVVSELEASRPRVVLFADPYFGLPDYDQIPQDVRAYVVSQYILDHYRPLVDIGGELVYLRDDVKAGKLPPLPPASQTSHLYFATTACTFGDVPNFLTHPATLARQAGTSVVPSAAGKIGETIQGWAIDPSTGSPVQAVWAVAGGHVVATSVPGTQRADVVSVLNDPGALFSGFSIAIPAAVDHKVLLYGLLPGGTVVPIPPTPDISVVTSPSAGITSVVRRGIAHRVVGGGPSGFADAVGRPRSSVARLPVAGRSLSGVSWIELRANVPFGRSTFTLTDEPGGSASHSVSFNTLPGVGKEVFVEVGSCPQWHGYRSSSALYLLRSGQPAQGLTVRLIR